MVITYTYDSLYRLTAADYSTGDFYHYTYDKFGNRLTQDSSVNGLPSSVSIVDTPQRKGSCAKKV